MIEIVFVLYLALASAASAAEPIITITAGATKREFTRAQLLESPHLARITVKDDPAYGGERTYDAVPFADLFEGLTAKETLLFKCLDGFSAPISAPRALSIDPRASHAYLAIERTPWPKLKSGATAGPFYLIWDHPERSQIKTEEWPYQLTGFSVETSIEAQFPKTQPGADASAQEQHGYKLFLQNCFVCHTMNGEGTSQLGPDLNIPHNPTEYLAAGYLKTLVRNPQNLRHWPQSKMSSFDDKTLSDKDIADITAYLARMEKRKAPSLP